MFRGFFAHRSLLGSLIGLGVGLILGVMNVPLLFLLIAPFIAGIVSGSVGGGAKAGFLTLTFGLLLAIPLETALVPPSGTVPDLGLAS